MKRRTNAVVTAAAVAEFVDGVRAAAGDDEAAHGLEDALHVLTLRAVADGRCDDPVACAREALRTLEIKFGRWRA